MNDLTIQTAEQRIYKTAADILVIDDIETDEVWVEQWQTWVKMRGLSGLQRVKWETAITNMKNGKVQDFKLEIIKPTLIALCAVDKDGKRLFTDAQVKALNDKAAAPIETLFNVAQRLNGLSEGDIEELEENLGAALNGSSGSN